MQRSKETILAISTTSFTKTPQAGDDLFLASASGLTEDQLCITYLAVMANDLGGAAKTLYSLDDGTNSIGVTSTTDLLAQDTARTEALSTDCSAHGARIWITTDGRVGYDASTLSADFQARLQQLPAGEALTDSFTYAIRLGNGTLSWATATVQITGVNDAPKVTGAVTAAALEDGTSVTLDALAHASDVDAGAMLSVTGLPEGLPAGVSYDAATHSFTLDPTNAAFQHLAAGAQTTVTVNYGVTDGTATTAASVSWTVTGSNDAPVVSGAVTVTASEDGWGATLDALAHASDVDDGAALWVTNLPASLPPGVSYDAPNHAFTLDPTHEALQHLAAGDQATVTVDYDVTDGTATTAASVSWTVTGTNDAPVITSNGGGAAAAVSIDENSTTVTTVTATDVDDGATQTYSIAGGADAAHFMIDEATGALSLVSAPNCEAPTDSDADNVYDVTVRVLDGFAFADQSISVSVDDVNEFAVSTPADTDTAADVVAENVAVGTVVGVTAQARDADATTNNVTYSLSDDASGRFAIDSATGVVTVAGAIDRELDASLSLTVRATSADGSTQDQSFTIAVGDVNDNAPVFSSAATAGVPENTAASTVVYEANATDADATVPHHAITYSLTGTDAGLFSIDADDGEVRFLASPDYEAPADANGDRAYQVVVHANDGVHDTAQAVTVNVTDVVENHVPTDLSLAITHTPGGNALPGAGTVLGTVSATDPDAGDTFTFSLLPGSSAGFSVNAGSGELTTTSGLAEQTTYTLDVQVRDAAGATHHEVFNVITGRNGADDNPLPSGGSSNVALAGEDVLYGSGGNDVIYGGSGDDWIFGQNGTDRLFGGAGNDVLSGGNQSDTFVFLVADGGGTDTLQGFVATGGNSDVLDISNLLAGSGYTSAVAAQFIQLSQVDGNTTLRVDRDGSGSDWSFDDVAVLQGVTGLNLGTLLSSGVIDTTA